MDVSLNRGFTLIETTISSFIALYAVLALVLIYQQSVAVTKAQLNALTQLNAFGIVRTLEHSTLSWFPTSAGIQSKQLDSLQISHETYHTQVNYEYRLYADTNMDGKDDTWLTVTETNTDTVRGLVISSVVMTNEHNSASLEGPTSVSLRNLVFSD